MDLPTSTMPCTAPATCKLAEGSQAGGMASGSSWEGVHCSACLLLLPATARQQWELLPCSIVHTKTHNLGGSCGVCACFAHPPLLTHLRSALHRSKRQVGGGVGGARHNSRSAAQRSACHVCGGLNALQRGYGRTAVLLRGEPLGRTSIPHRSVPRTEQSRAQQQPQLQGRRSQHQ